MRRALHLLSTMAATCVTVQAGAEEAAKLEEILVYGRMLPSTQLEIPQTIDVLDGDLIKNTGSTSVGDVLRFVPGAVSNGSTLDAFGDYYLMRGFSVSQTVNGISSNWLNVPRDTIGVERVEVLKGPASVLYGQLEPGAVINVVTKQPKAYWQAEGEFSYGRYDAWRAAADLTGPLTQDGHLRFRLTAAYENEDSFVDIWNKKHVFVSPVIAFDVSDSTTMTLEGFFVRDHWNAFYNGIPAEGTVLPNPNGPLPWGTQYTDPSWDGITRKAADVNLRIEHRFSDTLSWRGSFSWSQREEVGEQLYGLLGWDSPAKSSILRAVVAGDTLDEFYLFTNDLSLSVATGPIQHELALGFDYLHNPYDRTRAVGLTPSLDLYNPAYSPVKPGILLSLPSLSGKFSESADAFGVFFQDRIRLSERWNVIAGLRYSERDKNVDNLRENGAADVMSLKNSAWTSQLGILYNVRPNWALFASRSTSFLPVNGTLASGEPLEPETGTQYEFGTKADVFGGRLSLNAAIFHLTRGDLAVFDEQNPGFQITVGEQVAKGVELSARAELYRLWRLYAGYAYTDGETTQDTDPSAVGKPVRGVARHSLALHSDFRITEQFGLGAAATYTGERAGDVDNSFTLPEYWIGDVYADYAISPSLTVTARVDNVTDERYYTSSRQITEVWPAPPRTFRMSITGRF